MNRFFCSLLVFSSAPFSHSVATADEVRSPPPIAHWKFEGHSKDCSAGGSDAPMKARKRRH
jgi:hypothetical protein